MQYIGGKSKYASTIINIMQPHKYGVYVEPFAGGMNVISKVDCPIRIANDNNRYLIALWEAVVAGYVPSKISCEEYLAIKNSPDNYPAHKVAEAGFLASYKAQWFGGYNGSAKNGRDYNGEAVRNIMAQVESMQGVQFSCDSYETLDIPDGSLVYMDPPYANTYNYHSGKFNSSAFWEYSAELSKRCTVYVSEFNAPKEWSIVHSFVRSNHMNWGKTEQVVEKIFKLSQ